MSQVYKLEYSIFEPMMFRSSGEFDLSARGIQASASSSTLPSPSTIVGVLATLTLEKIGGSSKGKSWVEEYLSVLGLDTAFRCPFLEARGEAYVEDRTLGGGKLIKLENAVRKVRKLSELLSLKRPTDETSIKENLKFFKEIRDLDKSLKPYFNSRSLERVGVGLSVRYGEGKVAKKDDGLLYSASFVDYSSTEHPKVKVSADAKSRILEEVFRDQLRVPVRFGGEGRFSLLTVSRGIS
ncbi:hypothetical protein DRO58_07080, partial [Candidatus Bathyarchaeota archaeon]